MKIEVKNVKTYVGMSEETLAYTANVYVDEMFTMYAKNDGQGGPTCLHVADINPATRKRYEAAHAFAKSLPPRKTEYGTYPISLDEYIDDMVYEIYNNKALKQIENSFKRQCKTKTLFTLKSLPEGEYMTINSPYCEKVKNYIKLKHGDNLLEIINERYL